jgi:hypothetical protein
MSILTTDHQTLGAVPKRHNTLDPLFVEIKPSIATFYQRLKKILQLLNDHQEIIPNVCRPILRCAYAHTKTYFARSSKCLANIGQDGTQVIKLRIVLALCIAELFQFFLVLPALAQSSLFSP